MIWNLDTDSGKLNAPQMCAVSIISIQYPQLGFVNRCLNLTSIETVFSSFDVIICLVPVTGVIVWHFLIVTIYKTWPHRNNQHCSFFPLQKYWNLYMEISSSIARVEETEKMFYREKHPLVQNLHQKVKNQKCEIQWLQLCQYS